MGGDFSHTVNVLLTKYLKQRQYLMLIQYEVIMYHAICTTVWCVISLVISRVRVSCRKRKKSGHKVL